MRSSLVATTGLKLLRRRSIRDDAARRRWAVVSALVGLAVAGGLVGHFTADGPAELRTDPFSYFPSS